MILMHADPTNINNIQISIQSRQYALHNIHNTKIKLSLVLTLNTAISLSKSSSVGFFFGLGGPLLLVAVRVLGGEDCLSPSGLRNSQSDVPMTDSSTLLVV